MSIPKTEHKLTPDKAKQTVRDCVCAACYGQLIEQYNWRERESLVICVTEDCDTPGFVTRSWLEKQQAISRGEKIEARQVLQQAVPWMAPAKKTESQLLKELGF